MNAASDPYFHDRIRQQTNLPEAAQVLAECAEALGWDLAAFHVDKNAVDLPRAPNGDFIAQAMGWPADCLQDWRESGLGRHCPIAQRCETTAEPFAWDCDDNDWFGTALQEPQRKVIEHYSRYVEGGVVIPVRLNAAQTGYVSWSSRSGRHRGHAWKTRLGSMFFLSYTFLRHAGYLLECGKDRAAQEQLTARERECLTWAARGKSEEEIAIIIARSRDTVHFHLRNASVKLNAANRTHAVALACMRGLINPR